MTAGHFLNVDLEIESKADLAPLAAELEPQAAILYSGPASGGFRVALELESLVGRPDPSGANETINELCRLVESLSPAGRQARSGESPSASAVGGSSGHQSP